MRKARWKGSHLKNGLELMGWWAMFVPRHAHAALISVGFCNAPTRVCVLHICQVVEGKIYFLSL